MQLYEIYYLLENIQYVDRPLWDATRILSLFIAQKFCKKQLKLKDLFALPWDNQVKLIDLDPSLFEQNKEVQKYLLSILNKNTEDNGSEFKD